MSIIKFCYKVLLGMLCLSGLPLPGVTVDATAAILINVGVSGGWYEPATAGQGFSLDVIPESNQLVAYWFTYPQSGDGWEWFVAQGDISGASADLTIYQTDNGFFDQSSDVGINAVGTAKVNFSSCGEATWEYEFNASGLAGDMELVRLGSVVLCNQMLATANVNVVSHRNKWVNLTSEWRFEGCVKLGIAQSHGDETIVFTDNTFTLLIDSYSNATCQGDPVVQALTFTLQRIDKTLAFLGSEEVIANRFILTDLDSGEVFKQLWYVDDRGAEPKIAHGVLDSPVDTEGYPTEIHSLFFTRLE